MADNPILTYLPLDGSLAGRDRLTGTFTATGSGALRWAPAENARINYALNPSSEVDSAFWSEQPDSTLTRVEDDAFRTGVALEVTSEGTLPYNGFIANAYQFSSGSRHSLPASSWITIAVDVKLVSGDVAGKVSLGVNIMDAAGGYITSNQTSYFTPTAEVQRFALQMQTSHFGGWIQPYLVINEEVAVLRVNNWTLEFGQTDGSWFTGTPFDVVTGKIGSPYIYPICSQLTAFVEESTTNYCPNPSFETSVTDGWGVIDTTASLDTTRAYVGGACAKVVGMGVADARFFIYPLEVSADGESWTFSCRLSGTGKVRLLVSATDNSIWQETYGSVITLTDEWVEYTHTLTISQPTNASIYGQIATYDADPVTCYVDAVQLEKKSYNTSYCDGSLGTGYAWTGTAHASASTRQESRIIVEQGTSFGRFAFEKGGISIKSKAAYKGINNYNLFSIGQWNQSDGDYYAFLHNALQLIMTFGQGASDEVIYSGSLTADEWNVWHGKYNSTLVGFAIGDGAWQTNTRDSAYMQVPNGIGANGFATLFIGTNPADANYNGSVGPVAFFSRELTDSERAAYNTAIDTDEDLWALFEQRIGSLAKSSYDAEPMSLSKSSLNTIITL